MPEQTLNARRRRERYDNGPRGVAHRADVEPQRWMKHRAVEAHRIQGIEPVLRRDLAAGHAALASADAKRNPMPAVTGVDQRLAQEFFFAAKRRVKIFDNLII